MPDEKKIERLQKKVAVLSKEKEKEKRMERERRVAFFFFPIFFFRFFRVSDDAALD